MRTALRLISALLIAEKARLPDCAEPLRRGAAARSPSPGSPLPFDLLSGNPSRPPEECAFAGLEPSLLLEENSLSQPWNRILVWGTVGRRERNARSLGSWMPACFISMLVQHSARRAGPGTTSSHVPALLRSGIPSHQSTVVCRPEFGADASPAGSRASPDRSPSLITALLTLTTLRRAFCVGERVIAVGVQRATAVGAGYLRNREAGWSMRRVQPPQALQEENAARVGPAPSFTASGRQFSAFPAVGDMLLEMRFHTYSIRSRDPAGFRAHGRTVKDGAKVSGFLRLTGPAAAGVSDFLGLPDFLEAGN